MTEQIYTRVGDKGNTGSFSGKIYRKDDTIIEANGLIDECAVSIQRARIHFSDEILLKQFDKILEALYILGAEVSNGKTVGLTKTIDKGFTDKLEEKIDLYSIKITAFQSFSKIAAIDCEEARVRVRRLERFITSMLRQDRLRAPVYTYINRLSDYLFTMSVYAERKNKQI